MKFYYKFDVYAVRCSVLTFHRRYLNLEFVLHPVKSGYQVVNRGQEFQDRIRFTNCRLGLRDYLAEIKHYLHVCHTNDFVCVAKALSLSTRKRSAEFQNKIRFPLTAQKRCFQPTLLDWPIKRWKNQEGPCTVTPPASIQLSKAERKPYLLFALEPFTQPFVWDC